MFRVNQIFIILAFFSLVLLSSCSSKNQFRVLENFSIENHESSGIKIKVIDISDANDIFKISGELTRSSIRRSYIGHVDIALISPGKKVIDKMSVEFKPKFLKIRKNRKSRFKAEFKNSPPKGSVIRVAFHEYSKKNIDQYDCGANKAVNLSLNN